MDLLVLAFAATATAVVTGWAPCRCSSSASARRALRPWLLGFAAGVMGVASVVGLLLPGADEGSTADIVAGSFSESLSFSSAGG